MENKHIFQGIEDYVINLRREIHEYPEVDFDLPKTVAVVKRELDAIGIPYTEKYGKGSVVGYINPEKEDFTIAIRADMDALRLQERIDLPYRSKNDGFMHACGHDAHTAMLLGVAKVLKGIEKDLCCRVKLLFQPSEEGVKSGSVMMIENGVLDDVDIIIGQHVTNLLESGVMGVCPGESQASSRHFKIEVFGKSAHAAQSHTGIDALAVAVRMYEAIQLVLSREVSPLERCLCSVGTLNAGTTHNNVADHAVMTGTIRTFNTKVSEFIFNRMERIAKGLSEETGAKITVVGPLKSVCVYNNPYLSELVMSSMRAVVGEENTVYFKIGMGSEDFSRYGEVVPAVFFRLGTRNTEKGITAAGHHDDFNISEDALINGVRTMIQFVVENQKGIDKEKMIKSDTRVL
jgi:amidohydrolase